MALKPSLAHTQKRAGRSAPVLVIMACLAFTGCRQLDTSDNPPGAAKAKTAKRLNLDALRDDRAVAIEQHMDDQERRERKQRGMNFSPDGKDDQDDETAPRGK